MKILFTGYTGFIGLNLVKAFTNHTIYGVDIVQGKSVLKHYYWENLNDCRDADCIIHLAGLAHDINDIYDEKKYFDVNEGLTREIYDFYKNSTATKFIFFSSVKAVADSINDIPLSEDYPPDPKTPYGKSKLAAEKYILNNKILPEKKFYILRPCMIHGPGNKGNLNLLFKLINKGIPYPLGAFKNFRSFLSIWNLVYIINELIEKPINSGIYNLADDDPVSTNELVALIAEALNRKPRIWSIPKSIIHMAARTGDIFKLPINYVNLQKLTETYIVSNSKIKKELGIEKLPVTAVDGLIKTLETFV